MREGGGKWNKQKGRRGSGAGCEGGMQPGRVWNTIRLSVFYFCNFQWRLQSSIDTPD